MKYLGLFAAFTCTFAAGLGFSNSSADYILLALAVMNLTLYLTKRD